MIARLPNDPLYKLAQQALLTQPNQSWFTQIRNVMQYYNLPHPLLILTSPPTKEGFKKLVKSKVVDHWEQKLRAEAALLPSLAFFKLDFMSLVRPHRLWTTAGQNSFEVAKARVQLLFLSNQYPSAKHTRHWSNDNSEGLCTHSVCHSSGLVESRQHILL